MSIRNIIDRATTYLPTSWPLQSFIAINPLWDHVSQPISETLKDLMDIVSIKGTLPLKRYHDLYRNHDVQSVNLKSAITLWLQRIKLSKIVRINSESIDIEQSLCHFLLANETQKQLEALEQSNGGATHNTFQKMGCPLDPDQIKSIRDDLIKWCSAFFDFGQAPWAMSSKSNNLFVAWREFVVFESRQWKNLIKSLPNDPLETIEFLVRRLSISEQVLEKYILHILFQLKGWASLIKWVQSKQNNTVTKKTASIADLVAIWLAYEVYFIEKSPLTIKHHTSLQICNKEKNKIDIDLKKLWQHWFLKISSCDFLYTELDLFSIRWIWQIAWEKSYQDHLIPLVEKQGRNKRKEQPKTDFQAIFCIDTRSEGLRRYLEESSRYETFGFAGFFGLPFQLKEKVSGYQVAQSPPLIEPDVVLEFIQQQSKWWVYKQASHFINIMGRVKNHGLAPYALFELMGTWLSLKLIGKTFFPTVYGRFDKKKKIISSLMSRIFSHKNFPGFGIDEAANSAEIFLKTIGLTEHFSKIVLIFGHSATTDNNPYQSSFDCGACGGNAGTPNAIIACAVLNHPVIRQKLVKRQIHIPPGTKFIPGCHNTTTDKVDLFVKKEVSEDFQRTLKQLQEDLKRAGSQLRQERLQSLPGNGDVNNRQANWAEMIPELGLANNAAMIIGPRSLTRGLDLNRRVFLHSYDPSLDKDGSLLEGILTAPLVIAHWINAQYYFSTTDPHLYGSGNKAIHNVVSRLGVMEGNLSDLKIGLPIQSVYFQGELLHQPLKLLVIIYAKRLRVNQLLDRHPKIKHLFDGEWAYLHIMEPCGENGV